MRSANASGMCLEARVSPAGMGGATQKSDIEAKKSPLIYPDPTNIKSPLIYPDREEDICDRKKSCGNGPNLTPSFSK